MVRFRSGPMLARLSSASRHMLLVSQALRLVKANLFLEARTRECALCQHLEEFSSVRNSLTSHLPSPVLSTSSTETSLSVSVMAPFWSSRMPWTNLTKNVWCSLISKVKSGVCKLLATKAKSSHLETTTKWSCTTTILNNSSAREPCLTTSPPMPKRSRKWQPVQCLCTQLISRQELFATLLSTTIWLSAPTWVKSPLETSMISIAKLPLSRMPKNGVRSPATHLARSSSLSAPTTTIYTCMPWTMPVLTLCTSRSRNTTRSLQPLTGVRTQPIFARLAVPTRNSTSTLLIRLTMLPVCLTRRISLGQPSLASWDGMCRECTPLVKMVPMLTRWWPVLTNLLSSLVTIGV